MSASRKKVYLAIALGLAAANTGVFAAEQPSPSANAATPAANAVPVAANAAPAAANAPAQPDARSSRQLWSWQQVQPPVVPEPANKTWGHTPIDAYILKA
jgi:hypothetical protein